jgi:choline dehydrogenase-like flavoprotein
MTRQPRTKHDYLVAGTGSAGSVIVRRLLAAGHLVHVLEAGPVDVDERCAGVSPAPEERKHGLQGAGRSPISSITR